MIGRQSRLPFAVPSSNAFRASGLWGTETAFDSTLEKVYDRNLLVLKTFYNIIDSTEGLVQSTLDIPTTTNAIYDAKKNAILKSVSSLYKVVTDAQFWAKKTPLPAESFLSVKEAFQLTDLGLADPFGNLAASPTKDNDQRVVFLDTLRGLTGQPLRQKMVLLDSVRAEYVRINIAAEHAVEGLTVATIEASNRKPPARAPTINSSKRVDDHTATETNTENVNRKRARAEPDISEQLQSERMNQGPRPAKKRRVVVPNVDLVPQEAVRYQRDVKFNPPIMQTEQESTAMRALLSFLVSIPVIKAENAFRIFPYIQDSVIEKTRLYQTGLSVSAGESLTEMNEILSGLKLATVETKQTLRDQLEENFERQKEAEFRMQNRQAYFKIYLEKDFGADLEAYVDRDLKRKFDYPVYEWGCVYPTKSGSFDLTAGAYNPGAQFSAEPIFTHAFFSTEQRAKRSIDQSLSSTSDTRAKSTPSTVSNESSIPWREVALAVMANIGGQEKVRTPGNLGEPGEENNPMYQRGCTMAGNNSISFISLAVFSDTNALSTYPSLTLTHGNAYSLPVLGIATVIPLSLEVITRLFSIPFNAQYPLNDLVSRFNVEPLNGLEYTLQDLVRVLKPVGYIIQETLKSTFETYLPDKLIENSTVANITSFCPLVVYDRPNPSLLEVTEQLRGSGAIYSLGTTIVLNRIENLSSYQLYNMVDDIVFARQVDALLRSNLSFYIKRVNRR